MAADDLIVQLDLEIRVGASTLRQMLTDDGSTTIDSTLVTWALETASAEAYGLLRPGYTADETIKTLVDNDPGVKNAVVELAIGLAGTRRPGILAADGSTPYSKWRSAARKELKEWGEGKRRAKGETTAGRNQNIPARVGPIAAGDTVFIPTTENPQGKGGF